MKQNKIQAYKEAIVDTLIGTAIMAPLNFVVISVCFSLSFNALQTTIACTACLFGIAVVRKATVRLYYEKKNDTRRNSTTLG
jgi:uncharacterized membrane protein